MPRIGIVVGLRAEAACFDVWPAADRPWVVCVGANPERASRAAEALVEHGCVGLVSFGLAGGIASGFGAGELILADQVLTADGYAFTCDRDWLVRILAQIHWNVAAYIEPLYGSDYALTTPDIKRVVARAIGGVAVDMESHRVAEVARASAIPFVAIRAICDACHQTVPEWLASSIGDDGQLLPLSIAAGLARRPWDVFRLASLALDARRAYATLRRVALGVGPLFQFQIDR